MISTIIILWLFMISSTSSDDHELPVIIGGTNGEGNYTFVEVEVLNYNSGVEKNCTDGSLPKVPDFPIPVFGASAIYVDKIGIFVCGGSNNQNDCYKYDPYYNKSVWFHIDTEIVGVEDGAMTIGTPYDLTDKQGFWYMGGRNSEAVKDTFYMEDLDITEQIPIPHEGPDLSDKKYGHCAVNTRLDFESSDSHDTRQVMLIGGSPNGQSVMTYCKQFGKLCQGNESDEFAWRTFDYLNEERQGHVCTGFEHPEEGFTILVTNGNSSNSTEIFLVEQCSKCQENCHDVCSWTYQLKNKSILWMGTKSLVDAAMITFNGVPTILGGMEYDGTNYLSATSHLYQIKDDGEYFEWYPVANLVMKDARYKHSVVSVPVSFLCAEKETTSTESTTTVTTTNEASTSGPRLYNCSAEDQRNVIWSGGPWDTVTKECDEGLLTDETFTNDSIASWFCIGYTGNFGYGTKDDYIETDAPDRSKCVHQWIEDVDEALKEDDVNTTQVSETIRKNTLAEDGSTDIVGGDIITITELLGELLSVHESFSDRETDFEQNKYLTNNVLITTNKLLGSTLGWEEIIQNETRYESSSNLLRLTDSAGYLLFKQSDLFDIPGYNFSGSEFNVKSTLWPANEERPDESYCYKFDMSEICVPKVTFNDINDDDVIEVSAEYNIGLDSNLFPSSVDSVVNSNVAVPYINENCLQGNTSLGSHLVSLAINNGTNKLNILPDQPVMISFHHEATEVEVAMRSCVFWNFSSLSWSTYGCEVSLDKSNSDKTVCHCNHLTNFALIFDFTGTVDPGDVNDWLNIVTYIVLSISIALLIVTQIVSHNHQRIQSQNSEERIMADNNRNWSLVFAQFFWLVLGASWSPDSISPSVCQAFGALQHLTWLCVFMWTGVEGLIYHKHLKSNVFSIRFVPSRLQTFGFYSFGYGVPVIIVAITLIISAADGPNGILHYVQKFYDENGNFDQMVCWIDQDLVIWCFIIPVSLIIVFNLGVVIMIVNVAYHSASHQRRKKRWSKVFKISRNVLILSVLLGVTWLIGFLFPVLENSSDGVKETFEFVFIVINGSMGIYIFLYSVVFNKKALLAAKSSIRRITNSTSTLSTNRKSKKSTSVGPPVIEHKFSRSR